MVSYVVGDGDYITLMASRLLLTLSPYDNPSGREALEKILRGLPAVGQPSENGFAESRKLMSRTFDSFVQDNVKRCRVGQEASRH